MSVMPVKQEIEQICDALCYSILGSNWDYHRAVFDHAAYADVAMYGKKPTEQNQKDMIWAWCNRVYVANQCAYIFTYSHHADCDRKINFINDADHCNHGGELLNKPTRFFHMLESIRYNCYSNNGQCMLSGEDMQRLDNLIAMVARHVVCEVSRSATA